MPMCRCLALSDTTEVRIEAAGRGAGDPLIEIFDRCWRYRGL